MATSTERFGFTLPSGQDPASIIPLNLNTQNIEKYLGMTQDMLAPLYDATEGTYEVDDIVTYDSVLYKCIEAVETPEDFDETKWVQTTAVSEGGGGAGAIEKTQSEYNALTPAQKSNGAIYMVSNDGETIDTPLNMSDITVFRESNTNATSSVDETVVSWDGGSQIGLNYYYTAPVDVTGVKSIKYNLTTGSCYGGGAEAQRESWRFYVGVTLNPITNFQYDTSKMLAFNEHRFSNTTYTDEQCTIDVSEISGFVYLTILAHGWNATLTDVVISKAGDAVNKIYYMGTEYANTNGGSGGGDGYTETVLFEESESTYAGIKELSDNISNYDELIFRSIYENSQTTYEQRVSTSLIEEIGYIQNPTSSSNHISLEFGYDQSFYRMVRGENDNELNIFQVSGTRHVVTIIGVKYEGSGGGGTSEGEGVEIYSESEYIVGKWIDGKKLYQRTYHLAQAITVAGGGSWTNTGIDISDVSILVDSKFSQDVAVWDAINGINDNGTLKATILASGSLTVDTITIRYTKTVETPAPAWGGSVTNNYASFIDTDNVIYSTTSSSTTDTYTATEDCYIMQDIVTGSTVSTVNVDGETVAEYLVSGTQIISYNVFLKKGQVLTVIHGGTAQHTIKVFGITYASGGSSSGSSVEYSTEEKEVGTWIDGSKVYEKTIFNNNLTDTSTVPNAMYVGDIPNDVAIVTELSASVCDSTHLGWVTGGGISTVNGWNFGLHITSGKVVLYGNTVSSIQGGMAIVKIRYTKVVS